MGVMRLGRRLSAEVATVYVHLVRNELDDM
jgi:hypothetical protein